MRVSLMQSDMVQKISLGETADDLVKLLRSAMLDQFVELFRSTASHMMDGAVVLAAIVNEKLNKEMPGTPVALVVSQQLGGEKHLVVIQDGSRLFGDNITVTRQMFLV
jgi:hypothetical protein